MLCLCHTPTLFHFVFLNFPYIPANIHEITHFQVKYVILSVVLCFRCVKAFWLAGRWCSFTPRVSSEVPICTSATKNYFGSCGSLQRAGCTRVSGSNPRSRAAPYRASVSNLVLQLAPNPKSACSLVWTWAPQRWT